VLSADARLFAVMQLSGDTANSTPLGAPKNRSTLKRYYLEQKHTKASHKRELIRKFGQYKFTHIAQIAQKKTKTNGHIRIA